MTKPEERHRKALERSRKSESPWKKSGFLDKAIKSIRGDIEVDIREAVKKAPVEGTATLEGGTMWFPKGTWTTTTTTTPYTGTSIATGSGFYGGTSPWELKPSTAKVHSWSTGTWSSTSSWWTFDDLTDEQREMVRQAILEQI